MEVDDHQVQMIADDLLGLMAEDSRQVLRVLMGGLLGQVGGLQAPEDGLLVDSWNGAWEGSPPRGGNCSDPGVLRCIHIPGLHLGQSRAASEDRSQGRILSWGLQGGLREVLRDEDQPYSGAEPGV